MNFNFFLVIAPFVNRAWIFSSPDRSVILFLASLARKRFSAEQEIAPNYLNKSLSKTILIASA